ncbi:type I polyketide synthase [Chondromyces crocatus]|nr:type I polyketide synthase [Chondromyces crocatus]AKT41319.1 uncharacterized protein CMC5_054930 [Chondromyces crocatus]
MADLSNREAAQGIDIRRVIIAWLSAKLGIAAERMNPRERFSRHGVTSAMAAELMTHLAGVLGQRLPATLLWDHPTVEALARHLEGAEQPRTAMRGQGLRMARSTAPDEPIAIVGLSCRTPGAEDPDALWALLARGGDALTAPPPDRWGAGEANGGGLPPRGGFLRQVEGFDPLSFGISPREAIAMDPQQRLMLELTWEALDDAGQPVDALRGTNAGVFFGAMWSEYGRFSCARSDLIGPHTATGMDSSIISARVSYTFGLAGPSLTVNSACSSSLVAVHLACQSLRRGECAVALAGGVNLMLLPESTMAMARFGGLSPNGRSRAFDAGADGYARGEGAGVVVLKPLSRALADGDPIYCVIRGSAVNNDGFSNGLTAPNPAAQEDVLRAACADAGVSPGSIHYVEAHGTGTALGDPIEAKALGAVLGEGRDELRPLLVGSIKTNIGHLEAAAGIAGLIKVALAMKNGMLPASLHFDEPNPEIPFDALKLRVQRETAPWPFADEAPRAGVSSFGFGGTNAHVILEGWRPAAQILPLSASDPAGLVSHSERLVEQLDGGAPWEGVCLAAARRISKGSSRLAIVAQSGGELAARLRQGAESPPHTKRRLVWVFSGNGGQWAGMGRSLLRTEPLFRAELARWDALFSPAIGGSIVDWLAAGEDDEHLERADVQQPLLFALQAALSALWQSWGIKPDAVLGHSVGEVAAAYVAGALDAASAARVVLNRSRLQQAAAGQGAMAVVDLAPEALEPLLTPTAGAVVVAAINAPSSVVLSGETRALADIIEALESRGVTAQRVRVPVAYHSPQMDPVQTALAQALSGLDPRRAAVPILSTVTGAPIPGESLDATYWARNVREPVRFADAVQRAAADGDAVFLEVGPHPILARSIEQCLSGLQGGPVLGSLRRGEDDRRALLESLAALYSLGAEVRWEAVFGASGKEASLSPTLALDPRDDQAPEGRAELVVLSAPSAEALRALAASTSAKLSGGDAPLLTDVAYTSSIRRAALEHRAAVVARSRAEAAEALDAVSAGETRAGAASGRSAPAGPPGLAFVFSGQGPQHPQMGCALAAQEPVVRAKLDECAALIQQHAGWSLWDELKASEDRSRLGRTDIAQPALFALQVAVAALWRSWGITPSAVVGHSVGEIAAACVSGAIDLDEAMRVVIARGQAMQRAAGSGRMAAVEMNAAALGERLEAFGGKLSIAAYNAPTDTVVAGDPAALASLIASLGDEGVFARDLGVDFAFHTAQMDPHSAALAETLGPVAVRAGTVPLVSSTLGEEIAGADLVADYWARNIREPVRFGAAVEALLAHGIRVFVEVGPHPVLTHALLQVASGAGSAEVRALPSLRRDRDARAVMLGSLGELWVRGYPAALGALFPDGGRTTRLPAMPWQRERCWIDAPRTERLHAAASVDLHTEPPRIEPSRVEPSRVEPLRVETTRATPSSSEAERDALVQYYASLSARSHRWEHLRFGPFRQIPPDYSWVMTWAEPEQHPEDFRRVLGAIEEVWRFLFRGIDFGPMTHALDVGCGYSSDLLRLATENPHLKVHGYNISPDQIEIGRARAAAAGVGDRMTLFHRDSSRDELPGHYDLIIAFQVIHHIQDKAAVLANIGRHLRIGGLAVMAEILSNMSTPIDHPASTAYFTPKEQWAEDLARSGLRVVECVDLSQEVALFLHDDDFESKYAYLAERYDEASLHHLRGPNQLAGLLSRGLAIYALLRVQKEAYLTVDELLRINHAHLGAPTPYARVAGEALVQAEAQTHVEAKAPQGGPDWNAVLSASPGERRSALEDGLRRWVAGLLEIAPTRLAMDQPLRKLGVDSLLALQMRHLLASRFAVDVRTRDLLGGLSLGDVATQIVCALETRAADEDRGEGQSWEEGEI